MLNEPTRAYLYRVFLALVPLAGGYGLIEESEAGLWTALVAAILGVGLAVANTSTSKQP
jgi:hypothetical protein